MDLEYRKLGNKDIPAVKKLSRTLKITPSIVALCKNWLGDQDCFPFGCYLDKKNLIGIGNVRKKSKNLAWVEGIQVHTNFQTQDVAIDLLRFGEQYAKSEGYTNIGFITENTNQNLVTLGEKLDYEIVEQLCLHHTIPAEYTFEGKTFLEQTPISLKDAIIALRNLSEKPRDVINLFSEYVPLDYEILNKIDELVFYENKGTILVELPATESKTNKINGILYGSKEGVIELLNGFIRRYNSIEKMVYCLCETNLCHLAKEVGFLEAADTVPTLFYKKSLKFE